MPGSWCSVLVRASRRWRVRAVLDWKDSLSREQPEVGRLLHDELIFNMLVEEFARGDYALVRAVAHQFAGVAVDDDVRRLFVDATGMRLLAAPPDASEGSKQAAS